MFGSEHSLGQELGRLGCSVLSNTWNLDDFGTRRAVANLLLTAEPRACHIVLPEGTTADVQRFVCTVARHLHSKGRLCSFEMPTDLEKAGAVRVFLDRSHKFERPESWKFVAHRLANYSLSGFEANQGNRFPETASEPLCLVRRRSEASLHARCLAAALAEVPRWGRVKR